MEKKSEAASYEQVFIGGMLSCVSSHDAIDLNPSDFLDSYLSDVWKFCQTMRDIDLTALAHKFDSEYLGKLIASVPSSISLEKYAKKISNLAYRRRLSESLSRASEMARDGDLEALSNYVVAAIDDAPKSKESTHIAEIIADAYQDLERAHKSKESINFLPTGMRLFDEKIGGLQQKGLIIIAGRPSMGKTAFASSLAVNAGKTGKVLMISMEMSRKQLGMRFLAAASNTDLQDMMQGSLTGGDWQNLAGAYGELAETGIWINDRTSRTVNDIKAEARRFKRKHKNIDLLVIDYLTLLNMPDGKSKADAVGDVSREMKVLAGELGCPILLLSQLNRSLEQRTNKQPLMSDLRDSGAIEQDADQILFPFRPEVYDKKPENEGIADIIVAKNRNGRVGIVRMAWQGKSATFKEMAYER